jgi:hypothetical protein
MFGHMHWLLCGSKANSLFVIKTYIVLLPPVLIFFIASIPFMTHR